MPCPLPSPPPPSPQGKEITGTWTSRDRWRGQGWDKTTTAPLVCTGFPPLSYLTHPWALPLFHAAPPPLCQTGGIALWCE